MGLFPRYRSIAELQSQESGRARLNPQTSWEPYAGRACVAWGCFTKAV